jgi:Ca2+/Na+ antiporter
MIIAGQGKIAVGAQGLISSLLWLAGSVVVLWGFLLSKKHLSKTEGLILIGVYIAYVVWVYIQA